MSKIEIDCKNLMIAESGYWFCRERHFFRVDREYCTSCLLNKRKCNDKRNYERNDC